MQMKQMTVDGITYEISENQYRVFQSLLKDAYVVSNYRKSVPMQGGASAAREVLTDDVVKRLVGHTNVVYYNFDKNAWNTNTYNGHKISKHLNTEDAIAFKAAMEKEPKFNLEYEFIAPVTKTIDWKFSPGPKGLIKNPVYSAKGTSVIGNIIARNRKTGKCELYGKSWVRVTDYNYSSLAAWECALLFSYFGATCWDYRALLIAAHNEMSR